MQQAINAPAPVIHQVTCTLVIFHFVLEINVVAECASGFARSYFKKKVEAKMSIVFVSNVSFFMSWNRCIKVLQTNNDATWFL